MRGDDDAKRFSVVLFWLAKRMMAPGGKPKVVDAELQEDYYEALSDIPIQKIEWAAKHLFAENTWFPMPKEIRTAAMIAPSSVMPQINLQQKALPSATYYEDGSRKLQEILDSLGDGPIVDGMDVSQLATKLGF